MSQPAPAITNNSFYYQHPKMRFDINARNPTSNIAILNESESTESINRKQKIRQIINETLLEHKDNDWDGYGANPVNIKSLDYADKFLRSLSIEVPLPSLGCEPSGRVGIEWVIDKMRLSVGFNYDGTISYAGINREGKIFSGKELSELQARIKNFVKINATSIN